MAKILYLSCHSILDIYDPVWYARLDMKFTEIHKQKISQALKGKSHPWLEKPKVKIICPCGTAFFLTPGQIRLGHGKYHTRNCYYKYRTVYPVWGMNKGKHFSEEWRRHISETRKRLGLAKGANNPHWLGGLKPLFQTIRDSDQYNDWWWKIFKRDNYKCVKCGTDRGPFNINHKKPFSLILRENNIDTFDKAIFCKDLWDIKNGETLCVPCHRKTDTYGWKVWNKYFKKTPPGASLGQKPTEGGVAST